MKKHRLLSPLQHTLCVLFVLLGVLAFFSGLSSPQPQYLWFFYLLNNFYFLSISLIAVFFIAIHSLTNAGWPVVFRRIPEAMTGYLPLGILLMFLLYFGIHDLYHWSHEEAVAQDLLLQQKSAFLNVKAFMLRLGTFCGLWFILVFFLLRNSQKESKEQAKKNHFFSALFLVVFALTFSLASIDWIMSLEPHWYSTIFPWYVFSSVLAGGIAFLTLLVLLLKSKEYLTQVNEYHLHDLGKYLFAFSFFWGYLWFSQYILIWYSNIPEESIYYVQRLQAPWKFLFLLNLILNFVLPFALLLKAKDKKNPRRLFQVSLLIFLGHWFDFYLMIMPTLMKQGPEFPPRAILLFFGFCSLFLLSFERIFKKHSITPSSDPYYAESIHFHGY